MHKPIENQVYHGGPTMNNGEVQKKSGMLRANPPGIKDYNQQNTKIAWINSKFLFWPFPMAHTLVAAQAFRGSTKPNHAGCICKHKQ